MKPVISVPLKNDSTHIKLACPNMQARWRAKTFYQKEPETLRWIESFEPGDTFLDIGANVGLYTIYAAIQGHQVMAIEPESQNFGLLSQNLYLNKLSDKVVGLNIAVADKLEITKLFLSKFAPAMALHTVGKSEDFMNREMKSAFKQGVLSVTLDGLIQWSGEFFPNHVKIDVDGAEARIIAGAEETFKDSRLKSVLIELNEEIDGDMEIPTIFKKWGFSRFDKEQSKYMKKSTFNNTFNYIFYKK